MSLVFLPEPMALEDFQFKDPLRSEPGIFCRSPARAPAMGASGRLRIRWPKMEPARTTADGR